MPPTSPARAREAWLVAGVAVVLALVVHSGALHYGFSQDDFLSLARATGLAPRLAGPWRILANQWFWDLGVRLFGLSPAPFHAGVLLAHAATAGLLVVLMARRLPGPSTLVGTALYAAHPAHQGALYWISANSDPFATLFGLGAAAAYFGSGRWRWLAVPAFVAALAWKESMLLLPLALLVGAWLGPVPRRRLRDIAQDGVLLAMAAVTVFWFAGIAAFVRGLDTTGSAYATSPLAVPGNLLTYASWVPALLVWLARDSSDSVQPVFMILGGAWIACALAGLLWRPWRDRGAAGALLAALVLLAPVLPLLHHTYRYYLHAPLVAVAFAVAALFAAATRRVGPRAAWIAAVAVVAPIVASSALWVHLVEVHEFVHPGSHADRTVDRALIATHAIEDLRAAALPPGSRVSMWSPQSQAMARDEGRDPTVETYDEGNVRAALLDGLALRVALHEIDSVRFVRGFALGDSADTWAVYRWDGHLRVSNAGQLARVVGAAPR